MDSQPNPKRITSIAISSFLTILVLAIIVPLLWHYYHTGKLIIKTNNGNTITIARVKDSTNQNVTLPPKRGGELSVTLGTGTYAVTVNGNLASTIQTIILKPRQTLHYTINPISVSGIEPVAYENAQSIMVTNQQLVYLDGSSNALFRIDSQNNLTQVTTAIHFQNVKWATPSFGVGQDGNGRLYTIQSGRVATLKVPFSYNGQPVNFDVSPNGKIYVSYGADVYAVDLAGGFQKIYTAVSSDPVLAASVSGVAVSDSQFGKDASNIPKPLLASISQSGQITRKRVESERLAWSPSGQYLIATNEANPTIYTATLHPIITIPTSSTVGQFTWLNNTTVLYTSNNALWTYNVAQQRAQMLLDLPFNGPVAGLYASTDGTYAYLSTLDSVSQTYAIKRVSLTGRIIPDYIYQLQDIMPEALSDYTLNMVNFKGMPTVLVEPYSSYNSQTIIQSAEAQLQSQGFDISKLHFMVAPAIVSE